MHKKQSMQIAETVIFHNLPTETLAGNCELARCAKFDVVYNLKMPQIIALIEQSAECHQFIKVFLNAIRKSEQNTI